MSALIANWFFIVVLLLCCAMHLFGHRHGHSLPDENRHRGSDDRHFEK
jgi:Protein of unknown function (DUF2933)